MTFVEGHMDKGRVITGSSNFSQAGLQDNLEFNVELKNRSDYEFALEKFNELWKQAVDVSEIYVDTVENRSPYAAFSPYELYLKFLYEYFRNVLNRPGEIENPYLPRGFKKLRYQEEAVLTAKRILDEYGGVFISDVVGLGKTYMSALLARELDGRSLVIAPPALLDQNNPGSWQNVFSDFHAPQTDFESMGKLDNLLKRDISRYSNVFIDESHRFRTESNQTYEKLSRICRGKRVILVSATPLNNYPRDILSQIKLFQNGKNSAIPNLRNLDAFFSSLEKKLKWLDRQKDREKYFSIVRENSREIREKILKYLMVRRTRSEIEKYYGVDLKKQGLKFPEVSDPEALFYYLNPVENDVFSRTIHKIIKDFKYARYKPLLHYKGEWDEKERQGQVNLARFMKILLVKRLESSFHAFRLTLARFIRSYERVITEYQKGHVYISKEKINKIFEHLEAGDEESLQNLLEQDKAKKLDASDFEPKFLKDLEHDLSILHEVQDLWKKLKRDPKWEAFRKVLTSMPELREGKLIIFTESKETAEYLAERIAEKVDPRVIAFSGHSDESERENIIANFDPRAFHPKDDIRILVSTDVLSEGVNLHRSNTVINYDIPWNPTKLM
jgi:superfamily II DNA or RNA helicase